MENDGKKNLVKSPRKFQNIKVSRTSHEKTKVIKEEEEGQETKILSGLIKWGKKGILIGRKHQDKEDKANDIRHST